ncbi:phage tail spike protein [Clostridium felsineum]|uniref:Uncharacterized protein n=1 Tax=Clostridium felsineum TaxID=36839 RepID=A0A1S8L4H2_9CLOT|nr:phage tail spike protein [Clostridium felsineum]URZ06764.1 hypothetical protein CLROS_020970 [Clostridium felsineum]URZ11796.1 hypothetical protein CROST_025130 [Clostridium felsineum]
MITLLDKSKNILNCITEYKDLKIEKEINALDTLSFSIASKDVNYNVIEEECYIKTKENIYIIKKISINEDWKTIECNVNVEELKGTLVESINQVQGDCEATTNLALTDTGWVVGKCDINRKRNIVKKQCTVYDVLQEIQDMYHCEMEFDALNKQVNIYQSIGSDKGTYFIENLNLKQIGLQSDTTDYITQLIPLGKDGLTVESVNNNLRYVSNYQYSSKVLQSYWSDNRYTNAQDLLNDAIERLSELSKPKKSYSVSVIDLANLKPDLYKILDYGLGDTVTLISKSNNIKDRQRIKKIEIYPEQQENNTAEISNTLDNIEDLITRFDNTSNTVDNVTNSDGSIDSTSVEVKNSDGTFSNLNVAMERVGNLIATKIDVTELDATNARVQNLETNKIDAGYADIHYLKAQEASVKSINIDDEAVTNSKIAKEAVGNAQISDMDVSKLNAGDINADIIHMVSGDNKLQIKGNKLQLFADNNGQQERILLGQQDNGNYGLLIRGQDGQTILFDENGQTKEGFTDGYGKLDDKSLDPKKIDIEKVVTEINGATTKIDGSSITVDNKTLSSKFTEITETVDNINIGVNSLIHNGNFTKGLVAGSTTAPNYWGFWGGSKVYEYQGQTPTNSPNTIYIGHQTSNSGIAQDLTNIIKPNTTYTIAFTSHKENVDYVYTQMEYYDNSNTGVGNNIFSYNYSKSDTLQSFTFTSPSGFNRVTFAHGGVAQQWENGFLTTLGNVVLVEGNKAPSSFVYNQSDINEEINTNTTHISQTAQEIGFDLDSQTWKTTNNLETFKDFQVFLQLNKDRILSSVDANGVKSTIEQSPDAVKIGFNGITNKIQMDANGLHINDGGIDIKNNVGTSVFSSDANGNLNFSGVFEQYDSNGYKSVEIADNSIALYDWNNSSDFLGMYASITTQGTRGGTALTADHGNPLTIGYMPYGMNSNDHTINNFLVIDDARQKVGHKTNGGFTEDVSMVNYSNLYFYGNDYETIMGSIGGTTTNTGENGISLMGREGVGALYFGLLTDNNGSGSFKMSILSDQIHSKVDFYGDKDIYTNGNFYCADGGGWYYKIPKTNYDADGIKVFHMVGSNIGYTTNDNRSLYSVSNPTSDIKLKKNIVDSTENYLDIINKMKLHEFDYNGKMGQTGHIKAGVITQELDNINPKFTSLWGKDADGTEYRCPNWGSISPYFVGAIQKLSEQNNKLEKENKALTERLDKLENKLLEGSM